jgi:hypothetical protein
MSTPEGNVKLKIKAYLASFGEALWFFMPYMGGYGVRGIPDIIGVYNGHFFAIEVKAPGGKPKPWQEMIMGRIQKAGGIAIVADDLRPVKEMFEALSNAI